MASPAQAIWPQKGKLLQGPYVDKLEIKLNTP